MESNSHTVPMAASRKRRRFNFTQFQVDSGKVLENGYTPPKLEDMTPEIEHHVGQLMMRGLIDAEMALEVMATYDSVDVAKLPDGGSPSGDDPESSVVHLGDGN